MDQREHDYSLSVSGIEGSVMYMDRVDIEVKPGEVIEVPVRVVVDPEVLERRSSEIIFNLIATDVNNLYVTEDARFIGPIPSR